MQKRTIACLGDGLTGKAVIEKANTLNIEVIQDIHEADLIIASPGIPPSDFPKTDTQIISEIEWAYRLFQESASPPTLIAVTGTNGKSTVTAMISHVLDIPYAGNIGIPLINYVGLENEFPEIVVEVSSYQLETCSQFKPNISLFLNITPDHIRRHGSLKNYAAQKAKCHENQTPSDLLIYNEDDPITETIIEDTLAETIPFSEKEIDHDIQTQCPLPGKHNHLNVLATIKVAQMMGKSKAFVLSQLQHFKPLRHRLELVGYFNQRHFYNDSKSTNPDSTMKAVEAMTLPTHLILCGEDKGVNINELLLFIQNKTESITVFGDISNAVFTLSQQLNPDFIIHVTPTLEEALKKAFETSSPGDVILFSPSSSSYDQFNGFEDRGDQFCETASLYYESIPI